MTHLLLLLGLAAAVFLLAAVAQAITGFGSALVAVPVLAVAVDPVAAVVAATAVSLVLSSCVAWREREHVDIGPARTLTVAGIVGMPAGLVLVEVVDESSLQGWIAATMLVMVVLVASGVRIGGAATPIAGLSSGALLTSTGLNGPPLVMALVDRETRRFRATLQAVFAVQDVVALAAFALLGHLSGAAVILAAGGVLGLPLGWRFGDALFHRIPPARLRPLVMGGLVLTAGSMLAGALA